MVLDRSDPLSSVTVEHGGPSPRPTSRGFFMVTVMAQGLSCAGPLWLDLASCYGGNRGVIPAPREHEAPRDQRVSRHRLRRSSGGACDAGAAAPSRRVLARERGGARNSLARNQQLSGPGCDQRKARVAGPERTAGGDGRTARRAGLWPLASGTRNLQLP